MTSDEFDMKAANIRQLAALPPERLSEHLSRTHQNLETVAPNIAPHIHSAAVNAIKYLNAKLPGAGNELPQDPNHMPSEAEKSKWLNLHSVISDPTSILEEAKNGTLAGHHVEALHAVYPDLHQEMIGKINEGLGALKMKNRELPYQSRLQMSLLTGHPMDSTMTPQAMQSALMANRGAITETQGTNGQPKRASGVELDQINRVNELSMTPLEKRQSSKD